MHNEDDEKRIEAMVSCCLELDATWARDVQIAAWYDYGPAFNVRIAARAYAADIEDTDYTAAADGAASAVENSAHVGLNPASPEDAAAACAARAYATYVSERGVDYQTARQGFSDQQHECGGMWHSVSTGHFFDQAAVDIVVGYVVGCVAKGQCEASCVREALGCLGSSEAFHGMIGELKNLKNECDTWKRKRHQRLWMITWGGAIACGLGMALPMLWGAAVPWVCVLTGACVSGLLSCQDALRSQLSAGQVAWMLMGWTVIGLGAGVAAWGVLSLIASHGAALAVGAAATALCVVGLRSLFQVASHETAVLAASTERVVMGVTRERAR